MSQNPDDQQMVRRDIYRRVASLLTEVPQSGSGVESVPGCAEIDDQFSYQFDQPPRPAAVMVALVERSELGRAGLSVLYTKRSAQLRDHSGQVAFPGGKIDAGDPTPFAAARREAHEEVALLPDDVSFLGYLPTYHTGTNYLVTPVVVRASPRAALVANPSEVDDIFEVPLDHLMRAESYQLQELRFPISGAHIDMGKSPIRKTWRIDYDTRQIWGITANITRMFFNQVLSELDEFDGG